MKSFLAKSVPLVLSLSLFASPALAGTTEGENLAVPSLLDAQYSDANHALEGQISVSEISASNRMCSAFRKVQLLKMSKTKKGWKGKVAGWDATTADGSFRLKVTEGVWSVKTPGYSYENAEGIMVDCEAAKLTRRFKV
jgi:hypothetical protein